MGSNVRSVGDHLIASAAGGAALGGRSGRATGAWIGAALGLLLATVIEIRRARS